MTNRRESLYSADGTFNSAALDYDEATKDTVSVGEKLTTTVSQSVANEYKGDVFAVNGDDDIIFCTKPGCANTQDEQQFYPNAKSFEAGEILLL